jgi:hypothetical protein
MGKREGGRDHTASEVRESGDSMKTYGGHGDVSIAQAGLTKVTSTSSTTSAATRYSTHIRRPWLKAHLAPFFVVLSLLRPGHHSSTKTSQPLLESSFYLRLRQFGALSPRPRARQPRYPQFATRPSQEERMDGFGCSEPRTSGVPGAWGFPSFSNDW